MNDRGTRNPPPPPEDVGGIVNYGHPLGWLLCGAAVAGWIAVVAACIWTLLWLP